MSSFDKYRVHELAKDFGMTSKAIAEILTKYATAPKNHMQVLEDSELSLVFEYLTQHNQCATMEDLFKVPEAKPAAKKPEPQPQPQAQSTAEIGPGVQRLPEHHQQGQADRGSVLLECVPPCPIFLIGVDVGIVPEAHRFDPLLPEAIHTVDAAGGAAGMQ